MNKLDPDLKRLLQWARAASPPEPEEAPFGFSARVLAAGRPVQAPTLFPELRRTAWALSFASLALIVYAGLVLISQRSAPPPAAEFSSALSFLASDIAP